MRGIIESPYPDAFIPDNIYLHDFILNKFSLFGTNRAMVCSERNAVVTFSDIIEATQKFYLILQDLNVLNNEIVCLYLPNCFEFLPICLATLKSGAVCLPINSEVTEKNLVNQPHMVNASYIVTLKKSLDLSKLNVSLPKLKYLLQAILTIGTLNDNNVISFTLQISDTTQSYNETNKESPTKKMAFCFSSSGTTGLPKSLMLSHYNIVAMLHQLQSTKHGRFEQFSHKINDNYISVYGYWNIAGIMYSLLWPLSQGATSVGLFSKYRSQHFLEIIEKYQVKTTTIYTNVVTVTTLFVPPPVLVYLAGKASEIRNNLRSVKTIFCGGAPLPIEVNIKACELFNLPYIFEEYGLTETTCSVTMMPLGLERKEKLGSCGVFVANTCCKIFDVKTGNILPGRFQEGEVCVKGPQIMNGYLNYESDVFDKDGFFHTGDIGYVDNDGFLYLVGRIKEMIKVKGFQVSPVELENILISHSEIIDAAIVGIPDDYSGQILQGFVVLKPDSRLNKERILKYFNDKVVEYKKIRNDALDIVKTIPKSATGKILRRDLIDMKTGYMQSKL